MKIYLRFSTTKNIFSKFIRSFERSNYSHVSIVHPEGYLVSAIYKGVKKLPLDYYPTYQDFCVDAPKEVLDFALSQLGKRYDFLALFAFLFMRKWDEKSAWICSELVAWSFNEAGCPLLRTNECNLISPRDLLLSLKLEPIKGD